MCRSIKFCITKVMQTLIESISRKTAGKPGSEEFGLEYGKFFLIFKSIYQKKWGSTKIIQKVKKILLDNEADKASINTHAKKIN